MFTQQILYKKNTVNTHNRGGYNMADFCNNQAKLILAN